MNFDLPGSVTARFYDRIARSVSRTTEEVLQDALFKLAGSYPWSPLRKPARFRKGLIAFPPRAQYNGGDYTARRMTP